MDKAERGSSSFLLWDNIAAACARYKDKVKLFYQKPFYHFLQAFA